MNEKLLPAFAKGGPIALVAGVLLWVLISDVRADQKSSRDEHTKLRAELAEIRAEDAADSKAIINVLGQILMSTERTAYLQRVQCQNEANTPAELRACAKDRE